MKNNFLDKLKQKIINGEENSPFLFVSKNLELLKVEILKIASEICDDFWVPKVNILKLEDNWEKIKISEIKKFLEIKNTNTPYKFQIFFIENISRMTITSANSCLKFFEEPGVKNIIFLTNSWDSGVLETILSRVQLIDFWWVNLNKKDDFFNSLLENYFLWNLEIISYFFRNKLEKSDYINFLNTLVIFLTEKKIFIEFLDEIISDIYFIKNNNVNSRWIVDKWILKIN